MEIADAVETARQHVLAGLDQVPRPADKDASSFRRRLDEHLPELARLFHGL